MRVIPASRSVRANISAVVGIATTLYSQLLLPHKAVCQPCREASTSRPDHEQLAAAEDGTNIGLNRLYFIYNSHYEPQWIELPQLGPNRGWHRAIDTSLPAGEDFANPGQEVELDPADHYIVNPRSTVLLFCQQPTGTERRFGHGPREALIEA